jgi:hypothetical protein
MIEKWNRTTTLQPEKPEVILLDDFSAPRLTGFYILLTPMMICIQMIGYYPLEIYVKVEVELKGRM